MPCARRVRIGHGHGFGAAETGQRLIEQQQLRIEDNRTANLQTLALAEPQARGLPPAVAAWS
jgi:hypothetical protein